MSQVKIATCCYCGTRAALVLAAEARHDLTCRSCGAPLAALAPVPLAAPAEAAPSQAAPVRADQKTEPRPQSADKDGREARSGKGRRRKGLLERAWDEIEDLFD